MSNTTKVRSNPISLRTEEENKFHVLSQFVSNVNANIYSIHSIPPEMIASLFAKYSRSDEPIRDVLYNELKELGVTRNLNKVYAMAKLRDKMLHSERAREFHEKYTIGFGHESVSKLADGVNVAVDKCSILAAAYMRGGTRAGFQCVERSSRYQKGFFDAGRVVNPELLFAKAEKSDNYASICQMYLAFTSMAINFSRSVYETLVEKLTEKFPYEESMRDHGITEATLKGWINNRALDNARYTIPVAASTGLGIVANVTAYNHLMSKLFNHQSPEYQSIAVEMNDAVGVDCPVLTKGLSISPLKFRANTVIDHDLNRLRKHILDCVDPEELNRLNAPSKAEDICFVSLEGKRVSGADMVALLACVVIGQHTSLPPDMVYTWFQNVLRTDTVPPELLEFKTNPGSPALSDTDFALKVLRKFMGQYNAGGKIVGNRAEIVRNAGPDPKDPNGKTRFEVVGHEKLPRIFELMDLTYDMVLDFGAWRDLQTHSFVTRIDYPLMPSLGFAYPEDIDLLSEQQRDMYQTLFNMSASLWKLIADEPALGTGIAEYAGMNMWNVRKIMKVNLRELDYIIGLRTRWQGHFSYRRMSQMLYARTVEIWPILAQIIKVDPYIYELGRITKPVPERRIKEHNNG